MNMAMLIESYRGFAYSWQMDHIGHMNVQFLIARFDEAAWHFFARPGSAPGFLRGKHRGMAMPEQRTQCKTEVLAGSLLHIQTGLPEIRRKTIRFMRYMYNSETGGEVATRELTGAGSDQDSRKTTELPQSAIATRIMAGRRCCNSGCNSGCNSRLATDSNIH
jgi:acyl-CoA thioester hydrolase